MLPLLTFLILGKLPDLSVLPHLSCVILDKCAPTSVLYDLRQVAWHLLASHSQLSDLRQVTSPLFASISLLCSVHFSLSILSDFVWPQGLQQARVPWPSPTPRACSNSCTSSLWCHSTYSSSVINLASCNQNFQHLGLFQRVSFSHQVGRILELQLQHQSFQWIFSTDFL